MSARSQALGSITRRLEQTQNHERLRRAIQQPALYDGQGRVLSLGAAGGVPERKRGSTGGLKIGDPVGSTQGITSALPDAVTRADLARQIERLELEISAIRANRGIQVFSGDPNASGAIAPQDFNYQALFDDTNSALYYFEPSDGTSAGLWQPIPTGGVGVQDEGVALAAQSTINFIGSAVTAADDPVNNRTNVTITAGTGGGAAVTFSTASPESGSTTLPPPVGGYGDGHIWVHTGFERAWIYNNSLSSWISMGNKNFLSTPNATDTDAIELGDTLVIGKYSWFWDGIDWVKSDCCDGPEDPPRSSGCAVGYTWSPDCPPAPDGEACSPSGNFWTCGCPAIGICPP